MHEYHIVEKIVKDIESKAKTNNALKVTKVFLVMGQDCGCAQESVEMYFKNISQGTMLKDAKLIIKPVKTQLLCTKCNTQFTRTSNDCLCPKCKTEGIPTQVGKEFYVENIEIEES